MNGSSAIYIILLALCNSSLSVQTRDFSTWQRPWQSRSTRFLSSSTSSIASRQQQSRYYKKESVRINKSASHYLDFDEIRRDKRCRPWNTNFKTRRPNALSITSRLVAANVLIYAAQMFRPRITQWGIKLSGKILSGQELYRLFTPMFLHGNLIHLFTNMASLRNSGDSVERLFGPGRYLATYAVSGIAGNLLSAVMSPNPSLGASGAVFGVFGAYFVFLSRNDWLLGSSGDAISSSIVSTLGMNVMLGLINPTIDNWGHLGGFIGGAAMSYYFGPRLFLSDHPTYGRMFVDKPKLRLPHYIEAVPERIGLQLQKLPVFWGQKERPFLQNRRRSAPNRSIKPRPF